MSRILIVEDDPMIAAIMRTVLSRGGWDARHCATGEEALTVAAEWDPALILLDVDLPGINGFNVCSSVRASEHGEAPLIVMVTSNDDLTSKLAGFEAGADDYLVKPIDPQELVTRVSKILGARDAQADAIKRRRRDAMNELVAAVCHQVNSPLTGALGYLELALEEKDVPPAIRSWLEDCRREMLRVIQVIQGLKRVEDRVVPYLGDVTMIELPEGPAAPAASELQELRELDELDV